MFGGDGTMDAGWPTRKQWMPFEQAWNANFKIIQQSCENHGWGKNNDDTEMQAIKDSIKQESSASGIPKEFILAIMVQESKGCVRVHTTHYDFDNPGLMQSAGKASCNADGNPISPCPPSTIRAMIHDGTAGEGLRTTLKNSLDFFDPSGNGNDSKWYKTARRYNAGEILMNTNNLGIGPTKCYASDIANRLVQPFGDSACNTDVIATLTRAQGQVTTEYQQDQDTPEVPAPETPAPETPAPETPAPETPAPETPAPETPAPETPAPETPAPETPAPETPAPETPAPETPAPELPPPETPSSLSTAPIMEGAAAGCKKYYTPVKGETCQDAPIDFATLRSLNALLNDVCTNLWAGYQYCVAV
ncbi:hypothetical protein IQ07DRAFT_601920 [Pyrenochaeta sp. DS3sAY3a]|nr:hypothetical protein IQ07DRAFT_601920 [Pyrenochaeta sp. DS3sAY3a]